VFHLALLLSAFKIRYSISYPQRERKDSLPQVIVFVHFSGTAGAATREDLLAIPGEGDVTVTLSVEWSE
jgi:hypothetical protein